MSQFSADMTLREYFLDAYAPTFLQGARPATLAVYATTITAWDRLMPPLALAKIDNRRLAEFRTKVVDNTQSPHTANKYLRAVNALLAKAGPASRNVRDALGLLPAAPWVRLVKTQTTSPRAIPLDVLGLIYRACEVARVPRADGIDPAEWWRGLLVCASQLGLRRTALLGLVWSDYQLDPPSLRVRAELDKMGVERWKPVNRVVQSHLVSLRAVPASAGHRDRKIFAWPYRSLRNFYIQWHALQQAAGVPLEATYKFHDLKKTCGTQLATVAGAFAVRELLDHSSVEMSARYVAVSAELRAAVEQMPCPAEFFRARQGSQEDTK